MSFRLADKVVNFLSSRNEEKFTAREIANWIFENYPEDCNLKRQRSTATVLPIDSDDALIQQIVAEIGAHRVRLQKKNSHIKTTEGRPRKYYFTESTDSDEIQKAESSVSIGSQGKINSFNEKDMYPILSEFLWSELNIYSKRVDEKRSINSRGPNGNKWLYPDLVGLEDLSSDWHREVKDCVKQYSDKKTRLWSFEVKILINRSNVREVFFQTVSNSTWANMGCLVASEIEGADTLKELRILSSLHGIGFIRLDIENPSESQIMGLTPNIEILG